MASSMPTVDGTGPSGLGSAALEATVDLSSLLLEGNAPAIAETDVSSEDSSVGAHSISSLEQVIEEELLQEPATCLYAPSTAPRRLPLRWEFDGLTIWIELEEFDADMSRVIQDLSAVHGVQAIPQSHTTAIYGMTHLTAEEARDRLRKFAEDRISKHGRDGFAWPAFRKPVGVVQDIAVAGNPGQVCSIAWAQLTLASSPEHELALDALYEAFYGTGSKEGAGRHRPWTPHNSVVYDNPEETVLTLQGTLECIGRYPTLLGKERRVKALSIWNTKGRMEEWKLVDRVHLF